ncbi:hypothetical protein PS619_01813 [Pseudomonas fluorescens]|nr:hypothetical protein PS619_01813 [Pseudomonas fluorescens]VVM89474.1 hypothetical protein PS681_02724 [Pseudomonas fluorescens]VVN54376.1 hypothetical protein PS684_01721 [Pseudomonas fluorescens]
MSGFPLLSDSFRTFYLFRCHFAANFFESILNEILNSASTIQLFQKANQCITFNKVEGITNLVGCMGNVRAIAANCFLIARFSCCLKPMAHPIKIAFLIKDLNVFHHCFWIAAFRGSFQPFADSLITFSRYKKKSLTLSISDGHPILSEWISCICRFL